MTAIAQKLDAAIKAVCPIEGVSIGREDDRQTWAIQFKPEATAPQRAAAQAVLEAFDPAAITPEEQREAADETERTAAKVDGAVLALIDQTRAEWAAWAQANFPTLTVAERNRMGTICWLLAVAIRRLMR